MGKDEALGKVHAEIANHLGELSKLFKDGVCLTFIMRDPKDTESYIVVGDDTEPEKIMETIRRSEAQKPRVLTPEDLLRHALGI
jgi:hypothetical protein